MARKNGNSNSVAQLSNQLNEALRPSLDEVVSEFKSAIEKTAKDLKVEVKLADYDHTTLLALAVKGFKSYISQKRSTSKQLAKKRAERKANPTSKITSSVLNVRI